MDVEVGERGFERVKLRGRIVRGCHDAENVC